MAFEEKRGKEKGRETKEKPKGNSKEEEIKKMFRKLKGEISVAERKCLKVLES